MDRQYFHSDVLVHQEFFFKQEWRQHLKTRSFPFESCQISGNENEKSKIVSKIDNFSESS